MAGINAFALGVQMTNPRARVCLEWTSANGADGPEGALSAAERLRERDIRLISLLDFPLPVGGQIRSGLSLVSEGETIQLAAPQWRWGVYYETLLRRIRDKSLRSEYAERRKALNYYWGISAGVVDLVCSEKLPESVRRLAVLLRDSICSCFCDPFRGPLYAQDGRMMEAPHQSCGPEEIMRMDWLNENILGTIPAYQDLNDMGKATVDIVGVPPSTKEREQT